MNAGRCGAELEQVHTVELEKDLQIFHSKKETALQHIRSLTTENGKLKHKIEELQKQLHHNHSDGALANMETTGISLACIHNYQHNNRLDNYPMNV